MPERMIPFELYFSLPCRVQLLLFVLVSIHRYRRTVLGALGACRVVTYLSGKFVCVCSTAHRFYDRPQQLISWIGMYRFVRVCLPLMYMDGAGRT